MAFTAHWNTHSKGKSEKVAKNRYAKYLRNRASAPATTNEEEASFISEAEELEAWITDDKDSPELLGVIHNAGRPMEIPSADIDLDTTKIVVAEDGSKRVVHVRSWKKASQIGNDGDIRVKLAPKYYNKTGRGLIGTSGKTISQSLGDF